jgi:hypothetical protein
MLFSGLVLFEAHDVAVIPKNKIGDNGIESLFGSGHCTKRTAEFFKFVLHSASSLCETVLLAADGIANIV